MPSKTQWKQIGLGIVALLVLVLIFQNTDNTTFQFFFWGVEMPRFLLLFLTLVVGVILGILGDRYIIRKR